MLGDDKSPAQSTIRYTKKLVAEVDQVLDGMSTESKLRPDAAADKVLEPISRPSSTSTRR